MAERINGRVSHGHTPYRKASNAGRPSKSGLLSRVVGRLWTGSSKREQYQEEEYPMRRAVRGPGGTTIFLDCRDAPLLATFGLRSGDVVAYGPCSIYNGDTCTVLGTCNGRVWVIPDNDPDAIALPIRGSNKDEILEYHGFVPIEHRAIAFDDELTESYTEAQLVFLQTAPDIVVEFTGGPLAINSVRTCPHSLILSPCITKDGKFAFNSSDTIALGGAVIQIASALALYPDSKQGAVESDDN